MQGRDGKVVQVYRKRWVVHIERLTREKVNGALCLLSQVKLHYIVCCRLRAAWNRLAASLGSKAAAQLHARALGLAMPTQLHAHPNAHVSMDLA